jgi:HAD superfamily hydrolase (TIGR01509 family)
MSLQSCGSGCIPLPDRKSTLLSLEPLAAAPRRPFKGVVFDFNGTLSDDEWLLSEIFCELFSEYGKPLTEERYFRELAGLPDVEIVRTWLGPDHPKVAEAMGERVGRYRARVGDGSTVRVGVRDAVRYAAARVPVAVVSGAARSEVQAILAAAGLLPLFTAVVTEDDVTRGKPDPEGYRRALAAMDSGLTGAEVVAFEDTDLGIAAAKAAGLRCVAVRGTLPDARLEEADELASGLDVEVVAALLGESTAASG